MAAGEAAVKATLAAAALIVFAVGALGDPMARFSYSAPLAERLNRTPGAASLYVVDETRGRELADRHLLDAIQALIRVFPACGNRHLQFAYAYGEDTTSKFIAFAQGEKPAPKCPQTAVVSLSNNSGAVTVRSLPED
jgi:hypothetical protein